MDCLDLSGLRGKSKRLGRNLQKLRGVADERADGGRPVD